MKRNPARMPPLLDHMGRRCAPRLSGRKRNHPDGYATGVQTAYYLNLTAIVLTLAGIYVG